MPRRKANGEDRDEDNAETELLSSLTQREEAIRDACRERYKVEQDIDRLHDKHLAPLKDARKELCRHLKASTELERKDFDLVYGLFKRQEWAKELDEEADRDRIQDNLRMAFGALRKGEMLDFVDTLAKTPRRAGAKAGHESQAAAN